MDKEAILRVKLTPKSDRNEIGNWSQGANGDEFLRVYVTAVPEKGKANKALIALLSKRWKIPKTEIELIKGQTDQMKTLKLPRDPFSGHKKEPLK